MIYTSDYTNSHPRLSPLPTNSPCHYKQRIVGPDNRCQLILLKFPQPLGILLFMACILCVLSSLLTSTFLGQHARELVAVDFFVVPTVTFNVLFVFLALAHDRRRIVHFNVTAHPTAQSTAQQVGAALAAGATDNGRPGYRDYWPGYYAALVYDPGGHTLGDKVES